MPLLCRQASTHSVLELRLSRDVFDSQQAPSIPCFSLLCLISNIPFYYTYGTYGTKYDESAQQGPPLLYIWQAVGLSPNARVPVSLLRVQSGVAPTGVATTPETTNTATAAEQTQRWVELETPTRSASSRGKRRRRASFIDVKARGSGQGRGRDN